MKTILWLVALLAFVVVVPASAQNASWQTATVVVPNTSTVVHDGDSVVDFMGLVNVTDSTVTVLVTDGTTSCNSGPCQLFPAVTLQAHQRVRVPFDGQPAKTSVKWSASVANAVHGWMKGR